MNYITTKDSGNGQSVKLFYEDLGTGKPVIFIHGWPLSHEMWEYQVNELVTKGIRCISYDRRGFGQSSKPLTGYDYDTLTDDLKAIIDELNLEDVTLVGFSMGGGEVARYFGRHGGSKVSKVVLISAVTPFLLQTDNNPEGVPGEVFAGIEEKIAEDRIGFLDSFGKQFFGVSLINHPVSAPLLDYYRMLASVASPFGTMECVDSFSATDFREDLKLIQVPTLVIHGDDDKTVPIEASGVRTGKAITGCRYIVYEDAPHGLFYTHKETLNQDLLDFILP